MDLPKYKCHKEVMAARIVDFDQDESGDHILILEGVVEPLHVSDAYMHKHMPSKGGYYVKYKDGYESFSPAIAFESGYTKIE